MTRFPDGFVWGSATAAYQIEGAAAEDGRTASIWDVFAHTAGRTHHGDHGDIACDHYHRADADLNLMASLGMQAYRFSVSWSRVEPEPGGTTNPLGLDFYDRVVDGALARGIEPIVTLYHWDLPQWLQDKGGWANRDVAEHFADFTNAVVDRLGDRVRRWITLNEPYCFTYLGHLEGRHAPGLRDEKTAVTTVHHALLAHGQALARIREQAPHAAVGITLNLSDPIPATDTDADRAAAARVDLVENRMFLSPLFRGEYPPDSVEFYAGITEFDFVQPGDLGVISAPIDFLGINFYEQHRITADPGDEPAYGNITRGTRKLEPEPPVTAGGVGIRPAALYTVLTRAHREWTDRPLWITENGLALNDYTGPDGQCDDPERIEYYSAHFAAAARAIADGVPLEAYLMWSMMDSFEWADGYSKRFGIIYVDYPTHTRILKSSAHWLRRVIAANAVIFD